MNHLILVRNYLPEDSQALAEIYFHTIHLVNSKDYTKEQVDAWAPQTTLNGEKWSEKFEKTKPFIATIDGLVVGFAEFEPNGHIDCFYCHHHWIGKGIGLALMAKIHEEAQQLKIGRLFAEVSITAKPFFEKQGFTIICQQTIIRNNIKLTNYKMEKFLEISKMGS